jgi:hypothetical protein
MDDISTSRKRELRITSAILQAVLMMEAFFLHNTKTWMMDA